MSFEGPEKKLKVTRAPGAASLRSHPPEAWSRFAQAAGAQILSRREGPAWDAYILSESSLFVSDDACTIITCGRTNPVDAISTLLAMQPRAQIGQVIYERKSEHFPDLQPTRWVDDVARLSEAFPEGAAVRLGDGPYHVDLFHARADEAVARDATIEILMHRPDAARCTPFMGPPEARDRRAVDAIVRPLFAGHAVDEHAFEPDGYSLNATRGERYAALHVTPEDAGSYVSYETQAPAAELFGEDAGDTLGALVAKLAGQFRPETLEALVFVPADLEVDATSKSPPAGYARGSFVELPCAGYTLRYTGYRLTGTR